MYSNYPQKNKTNKKDFPSDNYEAKAKRKAKTEIIKRKDNINNESEKKFQNTKTKIKVILFKNGFILNNGPFRDINIPENKKFIQQVQRGVIPHELFNKGIDDLGILLENRKDEENKPTQFQPNFQGNPNVNTFSINQNIYANNLNENININNNTNKIINVNQKNYLNTKKEINENNTTSCLYKINNPVQIQYNHISSYIKVENNDEKNALKQKEKTKLERKKDINEYKRPIVINKSQINTKPIQARVNATKVLKNNKDSNNNNLLRNIKSKYLLMEIFNYLKQEKSLNIIRYNKGIQNRLEINRNDYIKCSKIEIEIILWEGKRDLPYSFINVNKEDEQYFHVYFDDNEKEIKKYSLGTEEKVNKIKIIIYYGVKSLKKLFYLCYKNKKITFKKFNIYDITDMNQMFGECAGLIELNLSNFYTNNVTDMSCMFINCQALNELNLTNFNTNKVKDMSRMFQGCSRLKELNLSNFNTDNVTNMLLMFAFCESLQSLNLSNFNTSNVVDMTKMFLYCSWLKEINISNFIIKTTQWKDMFEGCSILLTNKIRDKIKFVK